MSRGSAISKTPAIRFEGFRGAWEEKELERIFHKIGNAFVGTATPYYVESGHFYLESNNVKNGKINRRSEIFINDEFYNKQSDKWLKTGDLVMVQSGHVGHTAVIPPELNNIAAHALIMFAEPKEKISPDFFNCQFQTVQSKKKLAEITTGNTIKHILSSEMKEFEVTFPNESEQTKIGQLFQQLDTLINQHQQKHDKLLSVKKALLEKIFPQQGKTQPAIRFKGFSEAWEETNLGCNADFSKGRGYSKSDLVESGCPIILYGRLYTNYESEISQVDTYAVVNDKSIFSKGNEVVVPASGETAEDIARASAVVKADILLGGDLNVISPDRNIYPVFLALCISNGSTQKELSKKAQGKSVVHVRNDDLKQLNIYLPDDIEQTKIGQLFQQLDILINQHQSQLTKLNNVKQSLLSKMFV
jgi:type I restriction enzyme, S subunit